VRVGHGKEDLRRYYDTNAGIYDRWMVSYDRFMLGDARGRIFGLARGRTLELAVGTGLNLAHYPSDVDLAGIDYSPEMVDRARQRARALGHEIDLRVADAHDLPFGDGEFDTVVTTLFLSSVPAPERAASEAFRVLRSGGRFLSLDHVRSRTALVAWVEGATERLIAARTGVHLSRDPLDYVGPLGFVVEPEQRSRLGIIEVLFARKP
jgi:ubiquinone/menaquinone biosynthesis C-methylase UbiE